MITLLIGHRGSGKTALLDRIRLYGEELRIRLHTQDLDAEIERGERASVATIFERRGEEGFRVLERAYLARLVVGAGEVKGDTFIALGAGFTGPIPPGLRTFWVRRTSDSEGRMFPNRPRLDPALDPLDEFRRRFRVRESRYLGWADESITIPEGFDRPTLRERDLFFGEIGKLGGILSLKPEHFREARSFKAFAKSRLRRGVERLEIRDDLLGVGSIEHALAAIPAARILYSFRRPLAPFVPPTLEAMLWDWPAERGECTIGTPDVVSLHSGHLSAATEELEKASSSSQLKLAVPVNDFRELAEGHAWAIADRNRRSFLPTSDDGRWSWYRNHFRGPLAFFREGEGTALDQPLLLDWMRGKPGAPFFAAVIGDPVRHSHTPAEQEAFFHARGLPVYSIRMTREEWDAGALETLRELGLRFAAVTSPLKERAMSICRETTADAHRYGIVNTLRWTEAGWRGHATDAVGLSALFASVEISGETVVWGGGALLSTLKEQLPRAILYSARAGQPRVPGLAARAPEVVVWAGAVPRVTPPSSWKPRLVIDLGYREDSPARRFALRCGAQFVDGRRMFTAQAQAQRDWWMADGA